MKNRDTGVFFSYINNNKKTFIGLIIEFLLGIICGIFFINNININNTEEVYSYINSTKDSLKNSDSINKNVILAQSIKNNCLFLIVIWLFGCTLLANFFVYFANFLKGFSLGYTISAVIAVLGIKSGCVFSVLGLLSQNIILIPVMLILSQNAINIYINLRQNKYVSVKGEFLRYTVIMLLSIILAIIASFIETYISTNFLIFFKDFF